MFGWLCLGFPQHVVLLVAPFFLEQNKRRHQNSLPFLDFELDKPNSLQLWLFQTTWNGRLSRGRSHEYGSYQYGPLCHISNSPLPPPASPTSPKHLEASRETSPTCVGFKDRDLNSVSQLELVRGVTLRLTADTPAVFLVIGLIVIPRVVKTKISGQRWRTPLICCSFLRIRCFISRNRWLKVCFEINCILRRIKGG